MKDEEDRGGRKEEEEETGKKKEEEGETNWGKRREGGRGRVFFTVLQRRGEERKHTWAPVGNDTALETM